jgi:hypothetical protein
VDRETIEHCLAHIVGGTEGAYRRGSAVQKRRVLMQKWADYLDILICSGICSGDAVLVLNIRAKRYKRGAMIPCLHLCPRLCFKGLAPTASDCRKGNGIARRLSMDDEEDANGVFGGMNTPPEANDWLEQVANARRWVMAEIAPGIDRATFGASMVSAYALLPYRGISNPVIADWTAAELSPYFTEKGATPKDRAKAIIKYILTELDEVQARGVMELSTWSYSTVLELDRMLTTGEWVPDPYPLTTPQIVDKIEAIGGIFGGKALWDKHLAQQNRDAITQETLSRREHEKLKAEKLGKTVSALRIEEKQKKKDDEQKKRAPVVAALLHSIAKTSKPQSKAGPFCTAGDEPPQPGWDMETEFAFRVPGTHEWKLFNEELRVYLADCLLKK